MSEFLKYKRPCNDVTEVPCRILKIELRLHEIIWIKRWIANASSRLPWYAANMAGAWRLIDCKHNEEDADTFRYSLLVNITTKKKFLSTCSNPHTWYPSSQMWCKESKRGSASYNLVSSGYVTDCFAIKECQNVNAFAKKLIARHRFPKRWNGLRNTRVQKSDHRAGTHRSFLSLESFHISQILRGILTALPPLVCIVRNRNTTSLLQERTCASAGRITGCTHTNGNACHCGATLGTERASWEASSSQRSQFDALSDDTFGSGSIKWHTGRFLNVASKRSRRLSLWDRWRNLANCSSSFLFWKSLSCWAQRPLVFLCSSPSGDLRPQTCFFGSLIMALEIVYVLFLYGLGTSLLSFGIHSRTRGAFTQEELEQTQVRSKVRNCLQKKQCLRRCYMILYDHIWLCDDAILSVCFMICNLLQRWTITWKELGKKIQAMFS